MNYPDDFINKIICGDCLEVMRTFEDNSVDTIITDPPYGLSFMGKKWDYEVPSVEIWQECLRVLKPGGTALIFAGSRTQHRMAVNIEDAGFILKDTIMWLYGSGFPKATDISKQIQKHQGIKPIGKKPAYGAISSRELIDNRGWNNINNALIMPEIEGEAIQWNGYKSHGLKPAYEPILLCMKPNEGSYANNALKWGVAGLNIDGGRIGTDIIKTNGRGNQNGSTPIVPQSPNYQGQEHKGRFPANLILDEEVCNEAGEWKRYFYCAKASKKERNRGCEGLEEQVTQGMRNNAGPALVGENYNRTKLKNHHPTVKPLSLMKYLVTLTKMPNPEQVYLDPFCGSGTTLMACKELGRNYIGIEKEEEYIKIARKRVNATPEPLFTGG